MKKANFLSKLFSAALIIVLGIQMICGSGFALAAEAATYNGFSYEVGEDGITITGYTGDGTDIVIPGKIDGVSVTKIGKDAFSFSSLTSVVIPDSVTSIGEGAFAVCKSLKSVNIPQGVKSVEYRTFFLCSSLESIDIPQGVESLSDEAFGCSGLTSLYIPASVTHISDGAFVRCSGLESIEVDENNTTYDSRNGCNAIIGTLTNSLVLGCNNTIIPESVTSIGDGAFLGYSSLTSVTIPESVTCIGVSAFMGCSNLVSICIPDGVTSIEINAFEDCSNLTSVVIPDSVTSIGYNAFANSGLTSVTIPDSVTSIGSGVFSGCSSLTSIDLPENLGYISDYLFARCSSLKSISLPEGLTSIGDRAFESCSSLESISLPEGLTSIEAGTFGGCSSLKSISLPEGITSIGMEAFSNCSSLESISLPEGLTSIEEGTFWGCSSLTSITLPDGITSIGQNAFSGCGNLANISLSKNLTTIDEAAFYNCNKLADIEIPESVTSIGYNAFDETEWLVNQREQNPLVIVNGILVEARETYGDVVIPDGVTSINSKAFYECGDITSVSIPDSVISIGEDAFYGCYCLEQLSIPDSVTYIGEGALDTWNSNLVILCSESSYAYTYAKSHHNISVNLIRGVYNGFYYEQQNYEQQSAEITIKGYEGDKTEIEIPSEINGVKVVAIGKWAFDNSNITSITIPQGITNIGFCAFEGTAWLDNLRKENPLVVVNNILIDGHSAEGDVVIPDGVVYIACGAFCGASITGAILPDSVTTIAEDAFSENYNLTSVTIPDSVTSIGWNAFFGPDNDNLPVTFTCTRNSYAYEYAIENGFPVNVVDTIIYPSGNQNDNNNGGNGGSNTNTNTNTSNNKTTTSQSTTKTKAPAKKGTVLTVPGKKIKVKVTSSKASNPTVAFLKSTNKKAKTITIPATVKVNGITYKVTSIADNALKGNKKVTTVTIGKNVTKIGKKAFYGCKNLKKINMTAGKLKTIGKSAFKGIKKNATLKVKGTKKAKAALKKALKKTKVGYVKTWKIK